MASRFLELTICLHSLADRCVGTRTQLVDGSLLYKAVDEAVRLLYGADGDVDVLEAASGVRLADVAVHPNAGVLQQVLTNNQRINETIYQCGLWQNILYKHDGHNLARKPTYA